MEHTPTDTHGPGPVPEPEDLALAPLNVLFEKALRLHSRAEDLQITPVS
jgi:hypothetical protein